MHVPHYDVAILGAGPAGAATAIAFANKGKTVLLLEADPRASDRLAGEWLHPSATSVLDRLGVTLKPLKPFSTGRGWVLYPDDGSAPVVLPYSVGSSGHAMEHNLLVETLRQHAIHQPGVTYVPFARGMRIDGQTLTYSLREQRNSGFEAERILSVSAKLIVGASGRAAQLEHQPIGQWTESANPHSRMAGLVLRDVELPLEGYQHVFVGGPGPIVVHRIGPRELRVLLDVPLSLGISTNEKRAKETATLLEDSYRSMLPETLHAAFRRALHEGSIRWAYNEVRPRGELGREGFALVGDAVGGHHPLTGIGLVLALEDAEVLAESKTVSEYAKRRVHETRVTEMLAVALYEVCADSSPATVGLRQAVFRMLREKPSERLRTMGFISGQNQSHSDFAYSFAAMLVRGSRDLAVSGISSRRFFETKALVSDLGSRLAWLLGGTMHLTDALPAKRAAELLGTRTSEVSLRTAEARYGAALRASLPRAAVIGLGDIGAHAKPRVTPHLALERAYEALALEQAEDGSFEGEVVWCAMIAAQYVLAMHALGRPLSEERKRRVLLHFERTRTADGGWGLHPVSPPYLFVTTLVYVASRLLGVDKNDALLARAHDLIRREGGASPIPTWGKLWLAIVGLYDWKGVNPILPEVWSLPKWMPMHPSRYYCHTRNIYMGMATLYGAKFTSEITPLVTAIREEIFPGGYSSVDFSKTRSMLRSAEIFTPPTSALRGLFSVMNLFEAVKTRGGRKSQSREVLLDELRTHIRYEFQTTHHTCISPVSGLLDILALHSGDPNDPDIEKALAAFEGWIWEDDVDGLRVAGARSASWDTAFAMQALAAAYPHASRGSSSLERAMKNTLTRADAFLESQQIRTSMGNETEHFRIDPMGGYCFAGVWHGWPVSDCTAEAVLGRIESPVTQAPKEDMTRAVEFILRTQNSDGGFGSYESRRIDLPLEWMNPAEMFGDSMTEKSYVECTASCVAAMAAYKHRFEGTLTGTLPAEIDASIQRAATQLRISQQNDGSWVGVWGILHIYGTLFGIRGLLAAGVPSHDPAIRRACAFLKARQKPDGGWGEHFSSIYARKYVEHRESQYVQTAWALSALLEANDPDFAALERAANFLAEKQNADGTYDVQDPEGVFFHTALLDYVLYRRYFPLWALGLFETRRLERLREQSDAPRELRPH